MPAAPTASAKKAPLLLVCGDDEFAVKQRAKEVYTQWIEELSGMDHETIDGAVTNSGEALKAIAKTREALQTLPFFGTGKVVWLQNCNFLGEERVATAAVNEAVASLAQELKEFPFASVRLLISAGKVDKRKVFYKTIDKLGSVEAMAGWSIDDRDWSSQAEGWALKAIRALGKQISDEALADLISRVGPNARQLQNEIEKVTLYIGQRTEVDAQDVADVCTRNKAARAFALGDALGDRDLPRLLRCLDEELWGLKLDSQKSEIGLLYGLISKVRAMLLLKEMLREGWIKPDGDYNRFKAQLERVPREHLPQDKRFNPLSINAYVLYKALPQVKRYTQTELIAAMELLFLCNQKLVSSSLDEAMVLQQTLVQIVAKPESARAAA
ncbi:MAG TPA: DNA polymerase III subunit delta [Clostridia bacterium]|nr:DNA polymerase III subunit delta [Clostridia bacterium]